MAGKLELKVELHILGIGVGYRRSFSDNPRPYKSFYVLRKEFPLQLPVSINPGHIWGGGPRDILSVSVAADDAARADAWATAMYV